MNLSGSAHDRRMSGASQLRLKLELEVGATPLRGSLTRAGCKARPFWGWLELIQAIEDAIANHQGGSHEAHHSHGDRAHRR